MFARDPMEASAYPRSTVEAKWRRAWSGGSKTSSPDDPGRSPQEIHPRYVLAWHSRASAAADLSFLRRLVLADLSARFQRHGGRPIYLAHGTEGFPEAARTEPGAELGLEEIKSRFAIDDAVADCVSTSSPDCVRLAQWLFLRFFEANLLVGPGRPAKADVRESDASESLNGASHVLVPRRSAPRNAWSVDLLPYAERLFSDVDKSSWSPEARKQQKAMIGRRRGVEVLFPVSRPFETEFEQVAVFTTQVETISGATFLVIAPEHELLHRLVDTQYADDIEAYLDRLGKGEEPRVSGIRTGGFALNPLNLERIPVVLSPLARTPYSGGMVMAVPGHDAEFFALARRLALPVREVIHSRDAKFDHRSRLVEPWLGEGTLTNSGPYSGLGQRSARERIVGALGRRGMAKKTTRYALTSLDASGLSIEGPPVPLVYCSLCGCVPVPEADLPIPPRPIDSDESALATTCPSCGARAHRDPGVILPWIANSLLLFVVPSGPVPAFAESVESDSSTIESDVSTVESDASSAESAPTATEETSSGAPETSRGESEVSSTESAPSATESKASSAESAPSATEGSSPEAPETAHDESVSLPERSEAEDAREDDEAETESALDVDEARRYDGDDLDREDENESADESEEMRAGGEERDTDGFEDDEELSPRARLEGEPLEPEERREKKSRLHRGLARVESSDDEPSADDDEIADARDPDERARRRIDLADLPSLAAPDGPRFAPFRFERLRQLLPIDVFLAPGRLSTRALIATRFVTKFLYDVKLVPTFEPFRRFFRVGEVDATQSGAPLLHEQTGGKAAGRSPSLALAEALDRFGGDALRLVLIGLGPAAHPQCLRSDQVFARARFLDRVWKTMQRRLEKGRFVSRRVLVAKHTLIQRVTDRLRRMRFHTALSAIDEFVRFLSRSDTTDEEMDRTSIETFAIVLAPFAPFFAQELWSLLGHDGNVADAPWPDFSAELLASGEHEIPIWVDGRVRDCIIRPADDSPEELEKVALGLETVGRWTAGRHIERVMAAPGRFVVIISRPVGGTGNASENLDSAPREG